LTNPKVQCSVAVGALALVFTLACTPPGDRPVAVAGELDLSHWSFDSSGSVVLDGDWLVCWGQLVEPGDDDCPHGGWTTVPVPGLWSETAAPSPFGGKGVATYRLGLALPEGDETLFLRAGAPYTAYRLWIDGVAQGGAGKVGKAPETTSPEWRNRVFDLPRGSPRIELNLQLANFDFRGGGLRRQWLVGRPDAVQSFIGRAILRDALLAVVSLLVGLAYGLQFALRPSEPARGYLSLFALVIGLRAVPGSISDFSQLLIPWASWEFILRGEYLLTPLAIFAGSGFFRTKLPGVMPPRLSRVVELTALAVAFLALVAPIPVVLGTLPVILALPPFMMLMVLVSYGRAYRRGVEGAAPSLAASVAYAGVIAHDVTRTQTGFGAPVELFPYFFVVWLLSEASGMLQAFFRSFSSVEELSNQLLESNFELQEDESAVMRFVPFDILRLLGKKSIREIASGDHVRGRMTVLYLKAHVATSKGESAASDVAFHLVNARLQRAQHAIRHCGGVVSYQGADALFALFPEEAADAVRAAVEVLQTAEQGAAGNRTGIGLSPTVRLGIGIATGPLIVGTMGSSQHLASTLIGEPVDLAQRIEALTGRYGVDLLVDASTRDDLAEGSGAGFSLREADLVAAGEDTPPVAIVEVLDAQSEFVRDGKLAGNTTFQAGRRALAEARIADARTAFEECIARCELDTVSRLLRDRCREMGARAGP
jgi:adenylate cyclase